MIPVTESINFIDVQRALEMDSIDEASLPTDEQIHAWVDMVLNELKPGAELTVRIVDEDEIAALNEEYRNKQGSTNVLSFPIDEELPLPVPLLGDLVISAAVVEREAKQQNKDIASHWAHMIIHGTLHLLGFDHLEEADTTEMEQTEIILLGKLGISNPYEVADHS